MSKLTILNDFTKLPFGTLDQTPWRDHYYNNNLRQPQPLTDAMREKFGILAKSAPSRFPSSSTCYLGLKITHSCRWLFPNFNKILYQTREWSIANCEEIDRCINEQTDSQTDTQIETLIWKFLYQKYQLQATHCHIWNNKQMSLWPFFDRFSWKWTTVHLDTVA